MILTGVFQLLTGYFDLLQGNWIIKRFNMNRAGVTQVRFLLISLCTEKFSLFLAKKTSELWNPSSSLILSLEKNECNENCLLISGTVIVFQPVYSFPTTWCCICTESSLKFWRGMSQDTPPSSVFVTSKLLWHLKDYKWTYWAWIILKRKSGSDIS